MKQIKHHPNYSITEDGRVFSHNVNRFIAPFNSKGYLRVSLLSENKSKKYLVHRLVAECFIPNIEDKPQVNHINGIKTDNRIDNLEWCNNSENVKHGYRTGLYGEDKRKMCGDTGKITIKAAQKANEKIVLDVSTGIFYDSAKEASEWLGIKYWNVTQYLTGKRRNKTNLIYV